MWTFNGYDSTINLKVLPDKRVVKRFIVYPHGLIYFFVIFPRLKKIITIKGPFLSTLIPCFRSFDSKEGPDLLLKNGKKLYSLYTIKLHK